MRQLLSPSRDGLPVRSSRTVAFAAGVVVALVSVGPAAADDTEVFFGQTTDAVDTRPNVLFILDTSGSMKEYDDDQTGSRLFRMQRAMHTILDKSTNINIGLMSLNGNDGGGPVRFPVTPVEEPACGSGGCDVVTLRAPIAVAEDDTEEEIDDGRPAANGENLSIGKSERTGPDQYVGLRFRDLNIPQGATITSAVLEFEARYTDSGAAAITIEGHDTDDASPYTSADGDLAGRTPTSESLTFDASAWEENVSYEMPDISNVVQEIVNRPGWCGGHALALRLSSDGSRSMKSVERSIKEIGGQYGKPATLRVSYDPTDLGAGEGCMSRVAVAQVNNDNDDVEQVVSNGVVNRNSPDLELPTDWGTEQVAATRFTNVKVPAGAQIISASVEFEVQGKQKGDVKIRIRGEADANPPTFQGTAYEVSNRPKTAASVLWKDVPEANPNVKVRTADLAPVVQEIVGYANWQAGNALTIHYARHGGSKKMRDFESHDNEPAAAAKLLVAYRVDVGDADAAGAGALVARDGMKEVIDDLVATGATPLVSVHYEAAQYLLGGAVDFGLERGNGNRRNLYRVSAPDSYTGGEPYRPSGCTSLNLNASDCEDEEIRGVGGAVPTYRSPITQSCQTSHVVILSDGQANSNGAGAEGALR